MHIYDAKIDITIFCIIINLYYIIYEKFFLLYEIYVIKYFFLTIIVSRLRKTNHVKKM